MKNFDIKDLTLKEKVAFKDILLHSTYENLLDCGIKENLFWKLLLVVNEEYKNIARNLSKRLSQGDESRAFFFLKGFSGCGKTTFIRWFIKSEIENGDFKKVGIETSKIYKQYVNLSFNTTYSSYDGSYNPGSENNQNAVYLNNKIIEIIKTHFDEYKSTFVFISNNFEKISPKLEDFEKKENLLTNLISEQNTKSLVFKENFNSFIEGLSTRNLITICLLQKIIYSKELGKEMCFFCIDNLDSLNYGYLVKGFWEDFLFAYNKLAEILDTTTNWNIDIKKRLKLLFIVREHHYHLIRANLNRHRFDVIRNLQYAFSLTQPNLKQILEKRVKLAKLIKLDVNSKILQLVRLMLKEDEKYREKFYLPLFNYDLRKLNHKIVDIVLEKDMIQFEFDFKKYQKLFSFKVLNKETNKYEHPYRNGARGILIHCFLKLLFQSEEKYPIEPIFDDPPDLPNSHPFCSYCRLLLTLIYNLTCGSSNNFLDRNLDNIHTITTSDFSLDVLIKQLRIYENHSQKPLIPLKHVFIWLNNFYTLGNDTLTHLINITGKTSQVNKTFSFDDEIEIASKKRNNELSTSPLNRIHLRINPSGVVYLRYLIPHYEFFSSYKYWGSDHFTRRFKPLYLATQCIKVEQMHLSRPTWRYEFEVLLEDVVDLVERKRKQNDRFLESNVFTGSTMKSLPDYLKSNFVVRFRETKNKLYSTRVITTHLTYIDQFRRFLMEDMDFAKQINENRRKYGAKSKEEIRNFILHIQKKYIDLYFEKQNTRVFDHTLLEIMIKWKNHIEGLIQGRGSSWHSLDYELSNYDE